MLLEEVKHSGGVYQEFPIQNLAEKKREDVDLVYCWKLILGLQLRDSLAGEMRGNIMCFTNCSSVYTSQIGIQYANSITHDWCSL